MPPPKYASLAMDPFELKGRCEPADARKGSKTRGPIFLLGSECASIKDISICKRYPPSESREEDYEQISSMDQVRSVPQARPNTLLCHTSWLPSHNPPPPLGSPKPLSLCLAYDGVKAQALAIALVTHCWALPCVHA